MTTIQNDRPMVDDPVRAQDARHRQVGILLVVLAGVFWSLQGPAGRMIEVASGPQIIFWRSIGQLSVMLVVLAVVNPGPRAERVQARRLPRGHRRGLCRVGGNLLRARGAPHHGRERGVHHGLGAAHGRGRRLGCCFASASRSVPSVRWSRR